MKNFKQIVVKTSIIETLDKIREQLPKRGDVRASYGDAIQWQERKIESQDTEIIRLEEMLKQKKAMVARLKEAII